MVCCHPFLLCLLAGLLLWPARPAQAAAEFSRTVQQAYAEITKLRLQRGQQLIDQALRDAPGNSCALLVDNYADALTLLITDAPARYDKLISLQEDRIDLIESLPEKSPYFRHSRAEIYLHLAACKFKFGHEVQAAWDFRKAYSLLEENAKLYPDFLPTQKSLGLLHLMIGSVPQKYQWVLGTFGFRGTVKQGLAELKRAASGSHPFKLEAQILHALVLEFRNEEPAAGTRFFEKLVDEQPDNLLFAFLYGSILKKFKRGEEALQVLNNRPKGPEYLPIELVHHMLADLLLFKGQYDQSIAENKLFLNTYRGINYLKDARYKIYLAYYLEGDLASAAKFLKSIPEVGQTVAEEDKYAEKAARLGEWPNKTLLRARLLTDGGYNQQALAVVNDFDFTAKNLRKRDQIEYFYRKARIFHSLDNLEQAKLFYLKTVQVAGQEAYYFAPNAALQLGYLYQQEQDLPNARKYFQKVLTYADHEYKTSIEAKAKLALNSL